jgi:phenylacetate-CoA ligase
MAGVKKENVVFFDQCKEAMSASERKRYFDESVAMIAKHAYEETIAWKERFERAGIKPEEIQGVKDLVRVPILSKDEHVKLQREKPPFGGFLASHSHGLERITVHPGSLYDAWSDKKLKLFQKAMYCLNIEEGEVWAVTFDYHMMSLGVQIEEALRHFGAVVLPLGTGNRELQLKVMREAEVTGFAGTPSFLLILLDYAKQLGYKIGMDFKIRKAFVGGESLAPSLRRVFQEDYGINVFQLYGSSEIGPVAYECDFKSGMHIAEEHFVEVVDPATKNRVGPGEVGELVVTSLDRVYPLIRFGTGDLVIYTDELCLCGRTSWRLTKVVGRVGEALKVRGKFIHTKELDELMSEFPEISKYQMILTNPKFTDKMTLKLECTVADGRSSLLRERCKEKLGVKVDEIQYVPVGTIHDEGKKMVDKRSWA